MTVPTPPAAPVFSQIDEVDFTTGQRRTLETPPDGAIVSFGWEPAGRPAVIAAVPISTQQSAIWSKVRSAAGVKPEIACDPGAVYAFAYSPEGWELLKSAYGDCDTGRDAQPADLEVGLSGLVTGDRTSYRNATAIERRVVGSTAGGVVFESLSGEIIAAGDPDGVRTPLAFLAGERPIDLDLPDDLLLRGGVRERCLLVSASPDGDHPRLFGLRENRLLFKSDTATAASLWPLVQTSARGTAPSSKGR